MTESTQGNVEDKVAETENAEVQESGGKKNEDFANENDKKRSSEGTSKSDTVPKKAKIAMPPSVSASLINVEKYELDTPLAQSDQVTDDDVEKKITSSCLMLFGLHPLIREPPLKKMLEEYGTILNFTVRSAFANRYGHVEFDTIEQAKKCYKALNGATLLHKLILVQPGKAEARKPIELKATTKEEEKSEVATTG
jgi:RNA recognition motif-containing protein